MTPAEMYAEQCRKCLEGNLEDHDATCPFCGGEALVAIKADDDGETGTVQCDECGETFYWNGENLISN